MTKFIKVHFGAMSTSKYPDWNLFTNAMECLVVVLASIIFLKSIYKYMRCDSKTANKKKYIIEVLVSAFALLGYICIYYIW